MSFLMFFVLLWLCRMGAAICITAAIGYQVVFGDRSWLPMFPLSFGTLMWAAGDILARYAPKFLDQQSAKDTR
jgi:hypothetical protein